LSRPDLAAAEEFTSPSITTWAGDSVPNFGNSLIKVSNACLVWMLSGSVVTPEKPVLIP